MFGILSPRFFSIIIRRFNFRGDLPAILAKTATSGHWIEEIFVNPRALTTTGSDMSLQRYSSPNCDRTMSLSCLTVFQLSNALFLDPMIPLLNTTQSSKEDMAVI